MQTSKDPDKESIECSSLCICCLCGHGLLPGEIRHQIYDLVCCDYCFCVGVTK